MYEVDGNLLDPEFGFEAIGHGVNCRGAMGAGIALPIKNLYPDEMFDQYEAMCFSGHLTPGMVLPYETEGLPRLYNLATQYNLGADARIDALWASVSQALVDCWRRGIPRLALPQIGCGIGGLKWSTDKLYSSPMSYVCDVLRDLDDASPVDIVIVNYTG